MSNVIHFEYKNAWREKYIGCSALPGRKTSNLDKVTCGRCRRSRSYKAYRAYVLGLIDKTMLREIGLGLSGKLI